MNKRFLLIAIGLALLGFFISTSTINAIKAEVPVVVAKRDILPMHIITTDDVEIKKIPKSAAEAALSDIRDAIGQASKGYIVKGDIIKADHLENFSYARVSGHIDHGETVVALSADMLTSIAGTLRVGDIIYLYSISDVGIDLVFDRAEVVLSGSDGGDNQENSVSGNQGEIVLKVKTEELRNYFSALLNRGTFVSIVVPFKEKDIQQSEPIFDPKTLDSNVDPNIVPIDPNNTMDWNQNVPDYKNNPDTYPSDMNEQDFPSN